MHVCLVVSHSARCVLGDCVPPRHAFALRACVLKLNKNNALLHSTNCVVVSWLPRSIDLGENAEATESEGVANQTGICGEGRELGGKEVPRA